MGETMESGWSITESIAVSISTVVAALSLLTAVISGIRKRAADELLSWQQSVVQGVFQKNAEKWLTFDNIMTAYRTEAMAYSRRRIDPNNLSPEALRRILIRMVSSRVIDQKGGDQYSLLTIHDDRIEQLPDELLQVMKGDFLGAMKDSLRGALSSKQQSEAIMAGADNVVANRLEKYYEIRDSVVIILTEDPNRYRADELISRVLRIIDAEDEFVRAEIYKMIAKYEIVEDNDGRLSVSGILNNTNVPPEL